MHILDPAENPVEIWRAGVRTRMRAAARVGAAQLCQFEQWCEPACGAPPHRHAVEEILTVLAGEAEVQVGDEHARLTAGRSVIVPAGVRHAFVNIGGGTLHIEATLAAPLFEAVYDDGSETSRRWGPSG